MYGKSRQGFSIFLLDDLISQVLLVEFFSSLRVALGSIANSPLLAQKLPSTGRRVKSILIIPGLSCKSSFLFISFPFSTQGGLGVATISAAPIAKSTFSSAALDPTATLTIRSMPILSSRARISPTGGQSLGLDRVRRRWISRWSARC